MIRHLLSVSCAVACLMWVSCSTHVAGGATDTESGGVATGRIVDTLNVAIVNAQVSFYPESFDPRTGALPESLSVATDSDGRFSIRLPSGVAYTMIAQKDDRACSRPSIQTVELDTVELDSAVLRRRGSIRVSLPHSYLSHSSNVYVRGTPYSLTPSSFSVDPSDTSVVYAVLDSLPPGVLSSISFADSVNELEIASSLMVHSGDTVRIMVTGSLSAPVYWAVHNTSTGAPFNTVNALAIGPIRGTLFAATDRGAISYLSSAWETRSAAGAFTAIAPVPDLNGEVEAYLAGTDSVVEYHSLQTVIGLPAQTIVRIPCPDVQCIASDGARRFIVGTALGFYLYTANDTALVPVTTTSVIRGAAFDRTRAVWTVGSMGIVESDTTGKNIVRYWVGSDLGIATSDIRSVAVDSLNGIWAGSVNGELLRSTAARDGFSVDTVMPGEAIVAIAAAPGMLCAAGRFGTIMIRRAGSDTKYHISDIGLTSTVTSLAAARDGTLYIGTASQGLVSLHPSR